MCEVVSPGQEDTLGLVVLHLLKSVLVIQVGVEIEVHHVHIELLEFTFELVGTPTRLPDIIEVSIEASFHDV